MFSRIFHLAVIFMFLDFDLLYQQAAFRLESNAAAPAAAAAAAAAVDNTAAV